MSTSPSLPDSLECLPGSSSVGGTKVLELPKVSVPDMLERRLFTPLSPGSPFPQDIRVYHTGTVSMLVEE